MKALAYRTTMPFSGGLSPTTPRSMPVPLYGNTPLIQDIINGGSGGAFDDVHSRGSWAPGEDTDHSYKERGDEYKVDLRIADILNQTSRSFGRPREVWIVKRTDGTTQEFADYNSFQEYQRQFKKPFVSVTKRTKTAAVSDVYAKAVGSCVMIRSKNNETGSVELGAGFCIGGGLFVTCAHVIKRYNKLRMPTGYDPDTAVISLCQGDACAPGVLVAADLLLDVAIVKSNLSVGELDIEDSRNLEIGEEVVAVGSPKGFENNVTEGILSSRDRKVFANPTAPLYLFTDAQVLPGNSGGPLVAHTSGKVIGVVSLIVAGEGYYGLNAALPSEYLIDFMKRVGVTGGGQ